MGRVRVEQVTSDVEVQSRHQIVKIGLLTEKWMEEGKMNIQLMYYQCSLNQSVQFLPN